MSVGKIKNWRYVPNG